MEIGNVILERRDISSGPVRNKMDCLSHRYCAGTFELNVSTFNFSAHSPHANQCQSEAWDAV